MEEKEESKVKAVGVNSPFQIFQGKAKQRDRAIIGKPKGQVRPVLRMREMMGSLKKTEEMVRCSM